MDKMVVPESKETLILVCVDACEHSFRAFDWYCRNFYRENHTIGLVHVYTSPEGPSFGKHHANPYQAYDEGEYERLLQEVHAKNLSIISKFKVECAQRGTVPHLYTVEKVDSEGETICKLAKENNAACIVMGQRGLGAIRRTIFGCVSEYVLHHAHTTVLIVPPPKDHKCTN